MELIKKIWDFYIGLWETLFDTFFNIIISIVGML
jgi:hypothetical protein